MACGADPEELLILGCFPTLATIPVWIGLYQALSNVANEVFNRLTSSCYLLYNDVVCARAEQLTNADNCKIFP